MREIPVVMQDRDLMMDGDRRDEAVDARSDCFTESTPGAEYFGGFDIQRHGGRIAQPGKMKELLLYDLTVLRVRESLKKLLKHGTARMHLVKLLCGEGARCSSAKEGYPE